MLPCCRAPTPLGCSRPISGGLALSFILASACATPQLAHTVTEVAATASHRVAPNIVSVTTHSPAGAHHYTAGTVVPHPVNYVAPSAPAPSTTGYQLAPVVTKHVHLGGTSFVAGYATKILKPATPHLLISVPTVLKGSVAYNAPIVKEQIEVHLVQNPVLVERRVEVPYDVPVYQENIVKVPTPVVTKPIIKRTQAAPVVTPLPTRRRRWSPPRHPRRPQCRRCLLCCSADLGCLGLAMHLLPWPPNPASSC